MTRRTTRVAAVVGTTALAFSVFGIDQAGAGAEEGWTVDTEDCPDPDATNAPIEGTIRIGSAMPLSGPVAGAFEPAARGFQAYVAYANASELIPGLTIEVDIQDDQYDPSLTPGVVQGLIDSGVHMFAGNIGTAQNLTVIDQINEECIPHLSLLTGDPAWGDVEEYPWTTGGLTPYNLESRGYAESIAEQFPDASVALYYVNNEFGNVYMDAFREAADEAGLSVDSEQTVENGDNAPPTAQMSALAEAAPDVIMATPLGIQCITFLAELANAKAANAGWEPTIYITNTCASPLILGAAGEAANGIYTSASMGIRDVADPAVMEEEPVAAYLAEMESQGLSDIVTTAAAGWNVAETTVAVLIAASESDAGLTQASIIEAARSLDFHPSLVRENLGDYVMNGEEDAFYSENIQIVTYDAAAGHFVDVGEPYVFETSAEG
ncbi:MAG: ABC transporter substrate-binding protein [Actinomycetota bacterium]|nr:ABC transporter substrate-binding protein [Actinomycetota bacterium]